MWGPRLTRASSPRLGQGDSEERLAEVAASLGLQRQRAIQQDQGHTVLSPLQLEIGHSPLEEANSHAGVLGHCLVKCLGTKMHVEH